MEKYIWYAVSDGYGGGDVYNTWKQCKDAMRGFPNARWEHFTDEKAAWDWVVDNMTVPTTDIQSSTRSSQTGMSISAIGFSPSNTSPRERSYRLQAEPDLFPRERSTKVGSGPSVASSYSPSPVGCFQKRRVLDTVTSVLESKPDGPEVIDRNSDGDKAGSSTAEQGLSSAIPSQIVLSAEQQEVIKICLSGQSVFFTGSAGTGKSICLREIIQLLRECHDEGTVFVTASTGIAAINVGGTTLHSFAGVGLGKGTVEEMYRKVVRLDGGGKLVDDPRKWKKAQIRWRRAKVLIIDEISMIDGVFFDKLEELARRVRETNLPFGGIQLIICGDFFQLPPVPDSSFNGKMPVKFAFDAYSWSRCVPRVFSLSKVFRQKEGDLISVLNMLRIGTVDAFGTAIFNSLDREMKYADGIKPTELFPLRAQVELANNERLEALEGDELTYYARDFPGYDMFQNELTEGQASKLLDNGLAPRLLRLRVGAQVMLTKNMPPETGLVNGSTGIVEGFFLHDHASAQRLPPPFPEENDRRPPPIPWLDVEEIDPHKPSSFTQTFPVSPEKGNSIIGRKGDGKKQRWPVVRFLNGFVGLITPVAFEAVNAIGMCEATRVQVPLILAWALSIHKSQGQTLERVKVNLDGIFEKGQAYVALSRATSLEGLQVLNFRADKIMSHPRVTAWSKTIETIKTKEETAAGSERLDSDEEPYWRKVG